VYVLLFFISSNSSILVNFIKRYKAEKTIITVNIKPINKNKRTSDIFSNSLVKFVFCWLIPILIRFITGNIMALNIIAEDNITPNCKIDIERLLVSVLIFLWINLSNDIYMKNKAKIAVKKINNISMN
jgi:uncharacterized membrane protein